MRNRIFLVQARSELSRCLTEPSAYSDVEGSFQVCAYWITMKQMMGATDQIRRLMALGIGLIASIAFAEAAHAWGNDGHEITAYIAEDNLSPAARAEVAAILRVPDWPREVAAAMAAVSVLPDTEFRERDPKTISWHFINLCLQDDRAEVGFRCIAGQCVTAKINEYADRLRAGHYDAWGARGDLAFLIHLVGDVYQPLHAATNADQGGNCVLVNVKPPVKSLHIMWDVTLVDALESDIDSGDPRKTAEVLNRKYLGMHTPMVWTATTSDRIAWQSLQTASTQIYGRLGLPLMACTPKVSSCEHAPKNPVKITFGYVNEESVVAGRQLAMAGFALADLLNSIWK